jgi:hypothetical protein
VVQAIQSFFVTTRPQKPRFSGDLARHFVSVLTPQSNDGKFHMAPGFVTSAGQMYEDYLKSTFDCLYREGGKMMNIPMVAVSVTCFLSVFTDHCTALKDSGETRPIGSFTKIHAVYQLKGRRLGHDTSRESFALDAYIPYLPARPKLGRCFVMSRCNASGELDP